MNGDEVEYLDLDWDVDMPDPLLAQFILDFAQGLPPSELADALRRSLRPRQ